MWDFSSPTRDRTHIPYRSLTIGQPGKWKSFDVQSFSLPWGRFPSLTSHPIFIHSYLCPLFPLLPLCLLMYGDAFPDVTWPLCALTYGLFRGPKVLAAFFYYYFLSIYLCIYFWLHWVLVAWTFSSCSERGLART